VAELVPRNREATLLTMAVKRLVRPPKGSICAVVEGVLGSELDADEMKRQ